MPDLKPKQRTFLDAVIGLMDAGDAKPPSPKELVWAMKVPLQAVEGILAIGIETGEIVRLSNGFRFAVKSLSRLAATGREKFGSQEFDVAAWRDLMGCSRETAYGILEYFDSQGWTEKNGGQRKFASSE